MPYAKLPEKQRLQGWNKQVHRRLLNESQIFTGDGWQWTDSAPKVGQDPLDPIRS